MSKSAEAELSGSPKSRLRIDLGMFGDGTFAVYLESLSDAHIERRIASQIASLGETFVRSRKIAEPL